VPNLLDTLRANPYAAYVYSYPHKTAHRPLVPRVPLEELWAPQPRDALFLYLHVPFCEHRCGYCNLFSTTNPKPELVTAYLDAVERQARRTMAALGSARFARFAMGGGTPTVLDVAQLTRVFDLLEKVLGAELQALSSCVEVSPATATREKLRLLRERGVERVSIGVQSFLDTETAGIYRVQQATRAEEAIRQICELEFPTLNIDLIYGLPSQTPSTWVASLERALRFEPEEIYLYPLYVRPLTGLGKLERDGPDRRLELYRLGRDLLASHGYRQSSMRMFRRGAAPEPGRHDRYRCQEDGMVGLGCGARSYTEHLHYCSPFGVSPARVRSILESFSARTEDDFGFADHGIRLDDEDRRRRHLLLSLFAGELDVLAHRERFGAGDFPELAQVDQLVGCGLATREGSRVVLTPEGVELSDAVGPWLFSDRVRALMASAEVR